MIPATYPSVLDSSNRTKMLVYQVPSITGLTKWIDYIPVKSPTSESDLTLANTYANEGFILTTKVNDITGLVPFKDYVPIYLDSTATKAWSADNDGYIPMSELAGLLLDFTTGNLDSRINFSRTSNATVTRSDGTIGYAPHNLLTFSEQFDNAAWVKVNATATANTIVAPNGTTTAETITATATPARGAGQTPSVSAAAYTISIFAKAGTVNFAYIREYITNNTEKITYFDLSSGSVGTIAAGHTASITSLGSGWYRCVVTCIPDAARSQIIQFGGCDANGSLAVTVGATVYIWGAQLEQNSTATTYNPTTVKNLLGFSELFDNAAWTKSNSFVQTNLLTFSEAFDNAAWVKSNATVTANSTTAPNGYQTADTFIPNNATSGNIYSSNVIIATATTATASIYFKAAGLDQFTYFYGGGSVNRVGVTVTIANNNISNYTLGTATNPSSSSITEVGNGWYRLIFTFITPSADNLMMIRYLGSTTANGTNGIYIWGAQLVQGSDAGAYRRTDSASLPCYYPNHNGVVVAEQLHGTSANGTVLESYTASGGSMTFSIWMRRITGTGNVDITMDTGTTWTTQAITTSWARYSITSTPASGARTAGVRLVTSGDIIQIFGAQLSDSASLDPYVLNAAAAPAAAAYYGARFDYDPVTLQPKGLLIEEQRANLITYSDRLDQTPDWTVEASTITANTIQSPDGTQNADTITGTGSGSGGSVYANKGISANTAYTWSVYAKAGTNNWMAIGTFDGTTDIRQYFNLQNGVVGSAQNGTMTSATITPVGNGWYRCTCTRTVPVGATTARLQINLASADLTRTPNGTIYAWGAQLEAGAFATSYIPTVASQVTRTADVATIQGSNFYSWYNQNEGSIVSNNTKVSATSQDMYLISDGTLSNSLAIYADASNGTVAWNRTNGTNQVVSSLGEGITNSKTAYAYKIDNSAASVNGLNVVTDIVCLTPIVNQLSIGSQSPNVGGLTKQKWIKQISYYPIRLADTVLQGLTT